jgi:hypothetical protein
MFGMNIIRFNRFLFVVFVVSVVCSIIRIAIAAAPNPGHTWSEINSVAATVSQGGTGQSSLTANSLLLGNGTSAVQLVAPSTSGNVLKSNGTTWVSDVPSGKIVFGARATTTVASGSTAYCHSNAGICSTTSNATFGIDVPIAGTIKNLKIYMVTAPSNGISCAFTLAKATLCTGSFATTALTCTIVGDGSTKTCTDTANSVSISAGECLQLQYAASGGNCGTNSWSYEYDY